MPEFAIIFRSHAQLSSEELARRNAAARAWAIRLQKAGLLAAAAPLEERGASVTSAGTTPLASDGAVAAVLVVRAESFERALELVQKHPGLAFGTEIELRPVKQVAPREAR